MDVWAFSRFNELRQDFKKKVALWTKALPGLAEAQRELARELGEDNYLVETPVVYNKALDEVGPESTINWIVVADNPGKREQQAGMNRYLVGQSGKVMENFFKRELELDLRTQAIIINKTPIHTPKTNQLKLLGQRHPEMHKVLAESQAYMAGLLSDLMDCLDAPAWIMGLSELRPKGLFQVWYEALKSDERIQRDGLFLFNHFSMGSFSTDLNKRRQSHENTHEAIQRIGRENRVRILGY